MRNLEELRRAIRGIAVDGVKDGRTYSIELRPEEAAALDVHMDGPAVPVTLAIDRLTAAIEAATAPPAADVSPIQAAPSPPLAGWAYLELMGRRVIPAAWVEEDDLVGRAMLRVRRLVKAERPPGLGEPEPPLELEERSRIYSPATVYSIEWITEAEARERWLAWNGSRLDDGDDIPF